MNVPQTTYRSDRRRITLLAMLLSFVSFLWYFSHDQTLLYGDAVAHIVIARRIFDSLTPGWLNLGTVWLPLPHVLMVPFLHSDWSWQTGGGASLPSMVAYVAAVIGVFRLACGVLSRNAAWLATAIFALNPNLLYLQSVAMTESLFLAAIVWAIVYFYDFRMRLLEGEGPFAWPLVQCALALSAAMLIRYDGWFFTAMVGAAVVLSSWLARKRISESLLGPVAVFLILCSLAPAAWLAYNWKVYGNALEFATGPYSARAISMRMASDGQIMHPGWHDAPKAFHWYIKTARTNLGAGKLDHLLFWPALVASIIALVNVRYRMLVLLWTPLLFYTLAISYGGVPIFVPEWYSGAYVNVRYGTQLLPAVALGFALVVEYCSHIVPLRRLVPFVWLSIIAAATVAYASVSLAKPICVQEAIANGTSKTKVEQELAAKLVALPLDSQLLMYCGDHPGALMRAGIPIRRVVNENNWPYWQEELKSPGAKADYVVAFDDDPVAQAVAADRSHLEKMLEIHVLGQKPVSLYRSTKSGH